MCDIEELLILSLYISKISNAATAQDANTNLIYFDKSNKSLYEIYPVLISPNWVNTSIHICMYIHAKYKCI